MSFLQTTDGCAMIVEKYGRRFLSYMSPLTKEVARTALLISDNVHELTGELSDRLVDYLRNN